MRRFGQGRPSAIDTVDRDEEDEEELVRCIESKATYHRRRKETNMFINKRVMCKDFLIYLE